MEQEFVKALPILHHLMKAAIRRTLSGEPSETAI